VIGEQQDPVPTSLRVGGENDELRRRLDDELTAFNAAATGAGEPAEFSVDVTDDAGDLVAGLTGWIWAPSAPWTCCGSARTGGTQAGDAG
jgi:hypothetical protein